MSGKISKEEFKQKLDSGEYTLIDVRTQGENDEIKIAESLIFDISQSDFPEKIKGLDRNGKYLLYCASGSRSSHALDFMNQLGFPEVYDLEGGIMNFFRN